MARYPNLRFGRVLRLVLLPKLRYLGYLKIASSDSGSLRNRRLRLILGSTMVNKIKKDDEGAQFVRYFGPLLDALRGLGGSGSPEEVVERIAVDHSISDEVQNELLPSGQPRYRNQVHWARFYLVREGLLDSSKRGVLEPDRKGARYDADSGTVA
jgi:hypothetical protein